jgi:hypothetical protein
LDGRTQVEHCGVGDVVESVTEPLLSMINGSAMKLAR